MLNFSGTLLIDEVL